ncbi:ATP-binding protein [Streptomyces sp. NPDC051214]|uniref:ATP-binding protein n=1 Tax=Streptomyces sp. NPDC051214 TaxID=3155282 RepID=UPI003445CE97
MVGSCRSVCDDGYYTETAGATMTTAEPHASAAPGFALQLPCVPESVQHARTLVSSALSTWGMQSAIADDGEIVVSELLANVVQHTSTVITTVSIERASPSCVRIEVPDTSPALPRMADLSSGAECGRGLRLVAGLSCRWGYDQHTWGKTTWAELNLRAERSQ